jgi:hypothetical protein
LALAPVVIDLGPPATRVGEHALARPQQRRASSNSSRLDLRVVAAVCLGSAIVPAHHRNDRRSAARGVFPEARRMERL